MVKGPNYSYAYKNDSLNVIRLANFLLLLENLNLHFNLEENSSENAISGIISKPQQSVMFLQGFCEFPLYSEDLRILKDGVSLKLL